MANEAGSLALTGKRDFAKARELIAAAGYKGEKIVILDGVDQPSTHMQALVGFELLKKLGSMSSWHRSIGAPSSRAALRKNRLTKEDGASLPPIGAAPTSSTHRSIPDCAGMVWPPRGSAG